MHCKKRHPTERKAGYGDEKQEGTVAIDESNIVANHLYDIPAMPVFYLLDEQKNVILKGPTLDELLL